MEILPQEQINSLIHELTAANDRCLGCNKGGHFIKNCPNKKINLIHINKFKNGCKRCGRNNHKKKYCYAKKDVNGNIIKDTIINITNFSDASKNNDTIKLDAYEEILKQSILLINLKMIQIMIQ
jgi:hypothetical protein